MLLPEVAVLITPLLDAENGLFMDEEPLSAKLKVEVGRAGCEPNVLTLLLLEPKAEGVELNWNDAG